MKAMKQCKERREKLENGVSNAIVHPFQASNKAQRCHSKCLCYMIIYDTHASSFRGAIRGVAGSISNRLPFSWNCNCSNSGWRRDHEIILPDCMWSALFLEPSDNCWVVSGVHIPVHCVIPTPKSQLHCRTFTSRCCDGNYILNHGLGALCEPTTTTLHFIWTSLIAYLNSFCFFCPQRTWNCSICFPRPQLSPGNSGPYYFLYAHLTNLYIHLFWIWVNLLLYSNYEISCLISF